MALAKPYWFSEEKWGGIVSTASLLIGVAAANAGSGDVLVAGVAGLVAGAMSMAAGEYVSVSDHTDQKVRLDQLLTTVENGGAGRLKLVALGC